MYIANIAKIPKIIITMAKPTFVFKINTSFDKMAWIVPGITSRGRRMHGKGYAIAGGRWDCGRHPGPDPGPQ